MRAHSQTPLNLILVQSCRQRSCPGFALTRDELTTSYLSRLIGHRQARHRRTRVGCFATVPRPTEAVGLQCLSQSRGITGGFGIRPAALEAAQEVLGRIDLLRVNNRILDIAGTLQPTSLRSLDAIHLASALSLEDSLTDFVCYDRRLSQAAAHQGWAIQSPA